MSTPIADSLVLRWAEGVLKNPYNLSYVQQVSDWCLGAIAFARAQEKEEEANVLRGLNRKIGWLATSLATGDDTTRIVDSIRHIAESHKKP